jgi:leader peptidase (prepilin peptidase)/N-methyltransferase
MEAGALAAGAAGLISGILIALWGIRGTYRRADEIATLGRWWWLQVPVQMAAWMLLARSGWWALPAIAYAVVAGAGAFIDIEVRRLPDVLTGAAAAATLGGVGLAAAATGEWARAERAVAAGAVLFVVFLAVSLLGTMGGGDIKLAVSTGVALGAHSIGATVTGVLVGFLLAGLGGLLWAAAARRGIGAHVPFGPAMVAGALAALVVSS